MEVDEKNRRERAFVDLMVQELWEEEKALWKARPVTQRVPVQLSSIFILWKLVEEGRPQIVDAFEVMDICVSKEDGLQVWVESKRFLRMGYTIGHKPSLLAGDQEVFVWTPFYSSLNYTPHPGGRGWLLRTEVCIRTRSNVRSPVPEHTYLSPVGEFRARFRDFAEVRF